MKATWSVAVIYEDKAAREHAVKFCDHLVERFWASHGFDVSWFPFSALQEEQTAKEAAQKAIEAEVILFATRTEGEMPLEVKAWIESWVIQRGDREGSLIGLTDPGTSLGHRPPEKYVYLRAVAHRGGMDYLTQIPDTISHSIPDS